MKPLKCECGRTFKNTTGLKCHTNRCEGRGTLRDIKRKGSGGKICSKCNNSIKTSFNKHFKSCNGKGTRRSQPLKRIKGQPIIFSEEHKMKLSLANKGKSGKLHTEETKQLLSKLMKERYTNGWESSSCGRAKKYKYHSLVAGEIIVDGTWELSVSKYLDSIGVIWERNKTRFPYINLNGTTSTYCPDFWVDDWNSYIEVKGYKTDLDKCKWSQFKDNLIIWEKKELKELKIL